MEPATTIDYKTSVRVTRSVQDLNCFFFTNVYAACERHERSGGVVLLVDPVQTLLYLETNKKRCKAETSEAIFCVRHDPARHTRHSFTRDHKKGAKNPIHAFRSS